MQNWIDGGAEQVITYNVHNGLDAWRKLYHDQLPAIAHQKEMLMNEFNELSKAHNLPDLKSRIQDIERITSRWSELAQKPFSEEHQISKIKMLIRTSVYNYIAVQLRNVTSYDEIVQLIEAQAKDPVAGLMGGERAPALNKVQQEVETFDEDLEEYLEGNGGDTQSECGATIFAALKGKGKGEDKSNIVCYNCGGKGHYARECTQAPQDTSLQVLKGKGSYKGKFKGKDKSGQKGGWYPKGGKGYGGKSSWGKGSQPMRNVNQEPQWPAEWPAAGQDNSGVDMLNVVEATSPEQEWETIQRAGKHKFTLADFIPKQQAILNRGSVSTQLARLEASNEQGEETEDEFEPPPVTDSVRQKKRRTAKKIKFVNADSPQHVACSSTCCSRGVNNGNPQSLSDHDGVASGTPQGSAVGSVPALSDMVMLLLVNQMAEEHEDNEEDDEDDELKGARGRIAELEASLAAVNHDQCERLPYPILIDSGAAENVLPSGWAPQAKLMPSNNAGKTYSAANGSSIKNQGCKVVSAVTQEGQWKNLRFEVANVTKALASVSKICSQDQTVVHNPPWHEDGSYIYNWNTGEYTNLLLKDGVYVLDSMKAPTNQQIKPPFGRQGR